MYGGIREEGMESPTVEISRGLEALKLGVSAESRFESVQETPEPQTEKVVVPTCIPPKESTKALNLTDGTIVASGPPEEITKDQFGHGFVQPSNVPLVFPHLEHTIERPLCECTSPGHHYLQDFSSQDHICRSCGRLKGHDMIPQSPSEQEIVESFNSLCVSEQSKAPFTPQQPSYHPYAHQDARLLCRSCRQEACAPCYLDDTTVDDLVGYFDQILYLPKPMSEMAELMYT